MQQKVLIIDNVLNWAQGWESDLQKEYEVLLAPSLGKAEQALAQHKGIALVAASLSLVGSLEFLKTCKAAGFNGPMVLIANQPRNMGDLFTHVCKRCDFTSVVRQILNSVLEEAKI